MKRNPLVGCVDARDQLALHDVPSRCCLALVAPVDGVAVGEAGDPGERTKPMVVERGCLVGVGHEHDRKSLQPIHVRKVLAHLVEYDRCRRVGVRHAPRGRVLNAPEEADKDD